MLNFNELAVGSVEFWARPNPPCGGLDLVITENNNGRDLHYYTSDKLTRTVHEPGTEPPAFTFLTRRQAETFMQSLWEAGIRPHGLVESENETIKFQKQLLEERRNTIDYLKGIVSVLIGAIKPHE